MCGNAREGTEDIRGISVEPPPIATREDSPAGPGPDGVSVDGVAHSFGELETLRDLSFDVAGGETVAIVGPSGCGKSTLLELIAGLGSQSRGRIAVGGADGTDQRLGRCAWMPQRDGLLPWRRARDNAALALRLSGTGRAEARERASALLRRLGLADFERSYPGELSGGMRQRVAFARTLLSGKPVLLLDEPFASLDAITRADLQEWLRATLRAERRTTVLVTHDVEEALYMGDRVIVLSPRPGRIVWRAEVPTPPAGAGRAEEISEPEFVALRHQAHDRLREAMGS